MQFYGDDDTFFFVDAALEMLQHLDPEMPYFLTGKLLSLSHPIPGSSCLGVPNWVIATIHHMGMPLTLNVPG